MTSIVFIAGKKRSGKSTLTNKIVEREPATVEQTFAAPLKAACKAVFLLSDDQVNDEKSKETLDPRWGYTPRQILQAVGDLFRDHMHRVLPNLKLDQGLIFTQNMHWRIKALEEKKTPLIVLSDGRLPDEKAYFDRLPNSKISVKLLRNTGENDQHKSEIIPFSCDIEYENNKDIKELDELASSLCESVGNNK